MALIYNPNGETIPGIVNLINKYKVAVGDPDIIPRFTPDMVTDTVLKRKLDDKRRRLIEAADQSGSTTSNQPVISLPIDQEPYQPYKPDEPAIPTWTSNLLPNVPAQAGFGSKTMVIIGALIIGGGIIYKAAN